MGTLFTRAAKSYRTVFIAFFVLLASIVTLGLTSPTASADDINIGQPTGEGGSRFIVVLTGSKDPSKYVVTAKNSAGKSLTFKYFGSGVQTPGFYTDAFPWGGDNSQCIAGSDTADTSQNFSWIFTASNAGSGQTSVNYCGAQDGTNRYVTVHIAVTDGVTPAPGSLSGGISYVAADGTTQPFKSSASITIKKGNNTIAVPLTDDGAMNVGQLAPGTYSISGSYRSPQASAHGDTGKTINLKSTNFNITAATTTTLYITIGANGAVTTSTKNPVTPAGSTGAGEKSLDCGGGSFNWIICPGIMAMSKAVQTLDSFVMNTLNIDVGPIFDNGTTSNAYYKAWSAFRVLATGVLVIAGLVMVVSQAFGFEFLDAYTIRKTLPRLFIAAIGISLSWPLMRYVTQFFDVLGFDVRELIYAPFSAFSTTIGVGGGILTTIGLGAGLLILGPVSLTIILSALIAVFIGFIALVIRQIAIIMLIIIAPIAIVCYILPNTQRVWNLWRENFLGLMLAFPLISAVIATGKVFAAISLNAGNNATAAFSTHASALVGSVTGHSFLQHMAADAANNIGSLTAQGLAIFAWYAPYFIIGTIIQRTTGVISTLAGGAGGVFNRFSKGLQDMRSNAAAKNVHAMKTGNRFKGDSAAAKAFNRTTETIGALGDAGYNPRRMGSRVRTAMARRQMDEADEYMEKNSAFRNIKNNDDLLNAGIHGKGDDNKVRAYLRDIKKDDGSQVYDDRTIDTATAAIREARRDVSSEVFETAATMALPATGTAFAAKIDENGKVIGGGAGEMHEYINHVAGSDRLKAARMTGVMRSGAAGARRYDLAGGGFGDQIATLEAQYNGGNPGGMSVAEATEHIIEKSLDGQGGGYVAASKTTAVKAFAPIMLKRLKAAAAQADANGSEENALALAKAFAQIAGTYDAAGSVSPDNAAELQKVLGAALTVGGETKTIQQHVDSRTQSDPIVAQLRKDFRSRAEASARDLDAQARVTGAAPPPPVPPPGA